MSFIAVRTTTKKKKKRRKRSRQVKTTDTQSTGKYPCVGLKVYCL